MKTTIKDNATKYKGKLPIIGLLLLVCISVFTSAYFYSKYKKLTSSDESREVKILLEKIGQHMILPEEYPTVATVSDKEKLEKRPFFNNADNGDKVLIFSKSRKAILYRPSEDKIVDVAPIQLTTDGTGGQPAQLTAPQDSQTDPAEEQQEDEEQPEEVVSENNQEFSIVLLNGTPKVGVTHEVETELLAEFPNVNIEKKSSANRDSYNETLVISNSESGAAVADRIGALFNAKPSDIPEDENEYESDIIIIVGRDNS